MATARDALNWAHTQLGKPYSISSCRCSISCWALDCSGLICASVNAAGLAFPCSSSFGIADVVAHYGTQISENEAINTPGAIGIENPFGGSNFNGSNGHIVFFDGNGYSTTEEMGHAYGCCHGRATGRGFSLWAHFPGLDYSLAPPPPPLPPVVTNPKRGQDMIVQKFHYTNIAASSAVPIPSKNPAGDWQISTVSPSKDGKVIECRDNAMLRGATPVGNDHTYVHPDQRAALIVGIDEWIPDDGSVPGIAILLDDGRCLPARFE